MKKQHNKCETIGDIIKLFIDNRDEFGRFMSFYLDRVYDDLKAANVNDKMFLPNVLILSTDPNHVGTREVVDMRYFFSTLVAYCCHEDKKLIEQHLPYFVGGSNVNTYYAEMFCAT